MELRILAQVHPTGMHVTSHAKLGMGDVGLGVKQGARSVGDQETRTQTGGQLHLDTELGSPEQIAAVGRTVLVGWRRGGNTPGWRRGE